MHEPHRTSTVVKTAFLIFPGTERGLHVLHRSPLVVKTAHINRLPPTIKGINRGENCCLDLLSHKQACMCFTVHPRRLKRRYQVFFAHINRLAPTSQGIHSGENCFLDLLWLLNRLYVLHSTSSEVKTAISGLFRT